MQGHVVTTGKASAHMELLRTAPRTHQLESLLQVGVSPFSHRSFGSLHCPKIHHSLGGPAKQHAHPHQNDSADLLGIKSNVRVTKQQANRTSYVLWHAFHWLDRQ